MHPQAVARMNKESSCGMLDVDFSSPSSPSLLAVGLSAVPWRPSHLLRTPMATLAAAKR